LPRLRVVVPAPAGVKDPLPPMTLSLRSVAWVKSLLRLTIRLPLLVMLAVPVRAPVEPPLPSCSVPPLMAVAPV
jgi:hypothetical protein